MIGWARKAAKQVWLGGVRAADRRERRRLGMLDHDLLPALWDAGVDADGQLVLGGCDAVGLAERFGTPLFVVDKARLRKDYTAVLEGFRRHHPSVEVSYSYKTNPLPGVLRTLHDWGAGAEVISHFELWLALRLGVPPEQVIFNGPAKTHEALALAVSRGVRLINVDNLSEIDAIEKLAAQEGRTQRIGVRVVTSVGWSGQFGLGIRQGDAREAFERARRCPHLDPCALHLHLGTGIKNVEVYLRAVREVLEFADELRERAGVAIRFFDLGGGFGIPTVRPFSSTDFRLIANGFPPGLVDPDAAPRIEGYAGRIVELFRQHRSGTGPEAPVLIFEPGRAVTSRSQTLLLRVVAVKAASGGRFNAILDGGKNVAMPPGFEYHEVFPASRMREARHATYDLYGPLCHPGDVVRASLRMPKLAPGDVIAVMDAGAYFVPNQMNFSNPRCGAVMVDRGTAEWIRRHESFEDVVGRDELP
jgi:diaminopimelate decarboxylase